MRTHYKAYLFTFFSLAVLIINIAGTRVVFAHGQTQQTFYQKAASLSCPSLRAVPSPNVGSGYNALYSVVAVSASDVWAVGSYDDSSSIAQTLIEQWSGRGWSVVASPNVGTSHNILLAVAAVSASNIWAVGYYDDSKLSADQTLIEHWNGTNWSVVASPNQGSNNNALYGVTAVSASNIWAVGYYDDSSISANQTLIEHWNGTSWSIVASPNQGILTNVLNGVVAVSGNANNIWAVGYYSNNVSADQTLIEQWNGTSWSVVPSPNGGTSYNVLREVAAVSASNIWAVGYYSNSSGVDQTLIEQWNGTSWTVVASPDVGTSTNFLFGVGAVSSSNIWAVGYYINSGGLDRTLIEYWNGTSWSVVASLNIGPSNSSFFGVAQVPGSSNLWAVGNHLSHTLTEVFC